MAKVSLHAIDQLYKTHSEDPLLMLLTLKFPENNNFYYVNNNEDITSRGQLFTAMPFQFTLPTDSDEEVPELAITISNIGLELIDVLSSNTSGINADIELIFASVPDFVELPINDMILNTIVYDQSFITMNFGFDDILNVKIPSQTYSAVDFPGLLNV